MSRALNSPLLRGEHKKILRKECGRLRFLKKVPEKGSQKGFGIKAGKLNFVVSGPAKF